ncbi:MAG: hypothetical protein PHO29_00505 [Acetobacterium sp.]|nr:hypothetical protein [Acetobacterium sp.]
MKFKREIAKQAVLEYIKKYRGVTYVDIEKIFDRMGFDWQGNATTNLTGFYNIIIWDGWNEEAFAIINDLLIAGKITRVSTSIIVYLADGKALSYPIANKALQYKEAHWLPVVFNICEE